MKKLLLFLVAGCFLHSFLESVGDSDGLNKRPSSDNFATPCKLKRTTSNQGNDLFDDEKNYYNFQNNDNFENRLCSLSPKNLAYLFELEKNNTKLQRVATESDLSVIRTDSKLPILSRSQTAPVDNLSDDDCDECIVKTPSPAKTPEPAK